jgi:hypothetical protein
MIRFIPCPFPGEPGATIDRGPRKGLCSYQAELMNSTVVPPYYRCPLHGTTPAPADADDPASRPVP